MRRNLFLLSVLTSLALAATNLLSFKLIDEPFSSAVKLIEEKAKVKIILLNPIDSKVSIEANKATLPEVLDLLTRQVSAKWEEGYLITGQKVKEESRFTGPLVSLRIKEGTSASDAFKTLGEVSGVKILVNPEVKGKLGAMNFKNTRLERVIDKLCSSLGVSWQKVYIISKPQGILEWEKILGQEAQGKAGGQEQGSPGQRFRENYERFLQMSPEERVNLMANLFDRLFSLPADQRDRIIQNVAVFLSNAVNNFLSLPPERQAEVARFAEPIIRAGVAAYLRLPPEKQQLLKPWADAFAPLENYRPPR